MLKSLVCTLAAGLALMAPTRAQLMFRFTFDGTDFGNSAVATGTITFTPGNPPNPGRVWDQTTLYITDLTITVSGASEGNGTFTLSDFSGWFWSTGNNGTATLDLGRELVGQPTGLGSWAIDDGYFNLLAAAAPTPHAAGDRILATNGGTGDYMRLVSFAPVPEPAAYGVLAGLGLIGFGLWRRRSAKG